MTRTVLLLGSLTATVFLAWYAYSPSPQVARQTAKATVPSQPSALKSDASKPAPSIKSSTARPTVKSSRGGPTSASPNPAAPAVRAPEPELKSTEKFPEKGKERKRKTLAPGGDTEEGEIGERLSPEGAGPESEGPDAARKRAEYFYNQRAYPLAHIPDGARLKALDELDQMIARQQQLGILKGQPQEQLSIGFPGPLTWTLIGPQQITIAAPQGANFGNPAATGRVNALAVDPITPTTVFLGGANGGVWKSTDGGTTWNTNFDQKQSLAIGGIAIAPSDHLTIYVGTGENNFASDSYYGAGVYKSIDGGATWTQQCGPSGVFCAPVGSGRFQGGFTIGEVAVNPSNASIALAAVRNSANSALSGIYRTTDGGANWALIASASGAAGNSVAWSLTDTTKVYATLGQSGSSAAFGVYRSTDSGVSFTKLTGTVPILPSTNLGRHQLAVAPSDGNTVYVAIAVPITGNLRAFVKTTDGGASWTSFTPTALPNLPDFCSGQCFYDMSLIVSPIDPLIVVVGGSAFTNNSSTVFRTSNGGTSWEDITTGSTAVRPHVDTHAFAFTPNGGRLYTGNDGGAWFTDNPTGTPVTWATANNANLALAQYYPGFSPHPSDENVAFGGTQDNGTQRYGGSLNWPSVTCGDGGFTAIDRTSPTTVYAACQSIEIRRSAFDGTQASFFPVSNEILTSGDRTLFIPPLVHDINLSGRLYFGSFRIWQTMNDGNNWTAISPDLTSGGSFVVTNIATAEADPNVVYAVTSDGRVWRTTNAGAGAGATWTDLTKAPLPGRFATSVRVRPGGNANIVYVTYSGFSGFVDAVGHVFRSTDGGATWTDISGTGGGILPNVPVNDIAVEHFGAPLNFNGLYIGTDIGVFTSLDDGTTWSPLSTGLPRDAVLSLKLHSEGHLLYAATHGRSAWILQPGDIDPTGLLLLTSMTPASAAAGSGALAVTLDGNDYGQPSGTPVVLVDGVAAGVVVGTSTATQISATIPASVTASPGVHDISVQQPGHAAIPSNPSSSLKFSVTGPQPTLTSLVPSSKATSGPPFDMVVTGTDFLCGVNPTVVRFRTATLAPNGGTCTATSLTVTVPASQLTTSGGILVRVFNPAPGGGFSTASAGSTFTVAGPAPPNDNFANAINIGTVPFTDTEDTTGATTQAGEPVPDSVTCTSGQSANSKSIWYKYAPGSSGSATFTTTGSATDSIIQVVTGTLGSFTAVPGGCADNFGTGGAETVTVSVTGGTTYFIMISDWRGTGGTTVLNLLAGAPAPAAGVADLTIAKAHTGNFTQGQVGATYTITVTNSGASATSGTVTVVDTVPTGLSATGLAGTGWVCVLGTLTCTRSDALAAAGSYPAITLTVTVANNAAASVTNSAIVSGGGETNTANDSANDPTTVIQVADLTIAKAHTGNFSQGQTGATYAITVSNAGPGPTSGTVTVVDTLPASLTATAMTGTGWVCVLGTLTCTRSDVLAAAGSYPAITLTVNVAAGAPASVTNSAAVSGGGQLNTANDSANDPTTVTPISPDLTIAKAHTGNFTQGQVGATYTITATNSGGAATTGTVTVVDTLPTGLTATGLTGTGWVCVVGTLTCTRSDALAAAGSYPAITLTVTVANNAAASVTNSVAVSGGGETNAANDSATDPTTVIQLPDLTIAKSHTGNFTQGQSGAAYTITVTNSGSAATSGTVTVVDTLPTGLTATGLTGTGWVCVVGTLTCTRADALAAAGSYPAITLTVTVANNAAASVTNNVTVSGGGETNAANDSASDPTTVIQVADLTIAKSHAGNFTQGQVGATYTITVTNSGTGATSGTVTVVDTLPTGLTATGLTGTGWVCVVGTLTCTRSDALAAAGSYPAITLTVTVANNAAASVTNNVAVSGGGEANAANDSASNPTTIIQVADLTIAKSHAGNFTQSQVGATYTITVSNAGPGPTSGTVTVVDALPTGLTATGLAGTGWVCVVGTLTCTRSDVLAAAGSYPAITLTVTVASNAAASVTNSVAVSGGGELNTANDSASDPTTVIPLNPDLTITKTHTGNFLQGQAGATYTITVTNGGAAPTTGTVTVVDTLPAGLTATALAGTGWTCVVGTLTCTRADALAAAGSYPAITLTVTVAGNAAASISNSVAISGGGETNTANDSANDPTTVIPVNPDLTITKTHTGNFTQGQVGATYTITVTNSGGVVTAGTVTVVDTLPTGLSATGLTGTGWVCVVGTLTCTRADALAAAGSYPAITLTVTVAGNAAASITNTATVSGGGELNAANDTANDPTTVIQIPDLTIAKSHAGNFTQGQTGATYSITVSNAGPGPTSGTVTVVDTLPAGLTATGLAGTGWACVVGTLTCTRADVLAAVGSYPAITLTVTVATNAAASVTNNVTVSGGGETNAANDSASDPTTIVQVSDLTVAKGHTGNFTQGQVGATYTITVTNSGSVATSGTVTAVDTLPTGLTATGLTGTGWTCVVGTLTCTRADALAPAGSYPAITLTVTVANNAAASVTNSVTVSGGGETNASNDTATDPTTVIQLPDLTIAKTHTGNFTQGQTGATYTITVTNSGFAATTGTVTVVDTLPAGLTATGLTGTGWVCVVGTLTCTRADALAAAASYPAITLTVTVANGAAASVTNSVTVSGGGETNIANDSASDPTTIVQVADLTIAKTHAGNFTQGQVGATYTITVSNAGPGPTTGTVTVVDTIPAGLTATAVTGAGWTCVVGTLTCTRADVLAASGSYPAITLTVTVSNSEAASVTNSVTVSGGGEINLANDSASDPTTVIQLPDLTIAKTHAGTFTRGQPGQTYTITVSNTGFAPTSGTVTAADTLPAGLTATAITGTGWVCVLGTLTCTRADALPVAGSYPVITLTVSVATNAAASVTNTVTVSGGGETNAANDSANDPTSIVNPVPTIASISPTHSPAGAAFVLTVNGTNFVNASVVNLGGVAKTTTFVSSVQLTAALTATDVATGGAFNVSVTNAAPGGGTTANLTLTLDDYSLSGPAAAVTVTDGQSATYTFTITPSANGFPNAIQFSVTGLPAAATGSFVPPSLTPGSANGTTILTVTTKSRTGAIAPPASRPHSPFTRLPVGWFGLLTVILMGLATRALRSPGLIRMRFGRLAVVVVLLLCTGYLAGCVNAGFPEGNQGTPAGTYPLTVTATSGSAQHTSAVTLTVQ